MTFAQDIEEAAAGEDVEAVVIGLFGWGYRLGETGYGEPDEDSDDFIPWDKRGVVLSWDEARPLLDYPYDTGYGSPSCHAITAWTKTKVMWVTQYDGATSIDTMPREPVDHMPSMPGG